MTAYARKRLLMSADLAMRGLLGKLPREGGQCVQRYARSNKYKTAGRLLLCAEILMVGAS